MYTTNKTTKSIADAALKVMMGEAKSPAQQAAIAIAMKEKGQKPKEEMKEALHPNQQKLDVHEPEKDKLTAKDFEMLRKGKKAPTAIKEEDAYDKDRYAVKNGKAVKDNPTHMGSPNYKDQPHHVWASSAEEAMKKKKVNEGTVVGEILKRIDEMKGGKYAWPGTPEYKKQFPDREMKAGEEKATKTGVVKKTIKGLVHTAKPMKEEVEVKKEDEVKVLAKEEVSFQNLINLYMDNGVESLLKTVEALKEEPTNDEFHREVDENKKRAEGKVKQANVAEPSVKAVKLSKEEVEQVEEAAKWRSTSVAKKVTDRDDYQDSASYDYHHDNPRSTGMKRATSDTPTKYSSLSARPSAQVASQGARKGMITKQHAERLKARIKAGMNNEEVEQLDEISQTKAAAAYSARVGRASDSGDERDIQKSLKTLSHIGKKYGAKGVARAYNKADKEHDPFGGSHGSENRETKRELVKTYGKLKKEEVEQLDEASYSAKAARAGEDIGKPGKMFSKIAASAAKRYGSEEKGKKVAGAVLAKLRKEEIEELTDEQIEMIFEQIDAQLNERSMTEPEMKKREDIVKGMKKNLAGFKERYGKDAKSVMYATATARAKGE